MARHDFILDVTLTQDREISGVFAGDRLRPMRRESTFFVTLRLSGSPGWRML